MLDRIKARLIDEWKQAWRFWSVRIPVITFALEGTLQAFPADVRAQIPFGEYIFPLGMALSLFARILKQSDRSGTSND